MKPLNLVMAALVAASSASILTPGTAFATEPTNDAHAQAVKDKHEVVSKLVGLIPANAAARKSAQDRVAQFVTGKDPQYLTDDVMKNAKLMKGAAAASRDWVVKHKDDMAAYLYFVLGPANDDKTAWETDDLHAKFKTGMEWAPKLARALKNEGYTGDKRVNASDGANGVIGFLNIAAERAKKIIDDDSTDADTQTSVEHNDTTGTKPPIDARTRKNPLDGTGAGFGYDDLYRNGAVVMKVYRGNDDGFREVSMKIYTVKQDDGSLQNMIGITDVTNPTEQYKVTYYPVTTTGKQTVSLKDGGRGYTLNVGEDGTITFSRAGAKDGDGSAALTASLGELYDKRAAQVREGGIVRIPEQGGQEYYTLGQGGSRGSVLFFPRTALDDPNTDKRLLRPAAMGDVTMLDKDGATIPVPWQPDLAGLLPNGIDADGSQKMDQFHMVFDVRAHMWKVVQGKSQHPEPPKATTDKAPDKKPDDKKGGGNTPPGTGGDNNNNAGPAKPLGEAVEAAKTAGWTETGGNTDPLKDKMRIMTMMKDGRRAIELLFAPDLGVGDHFEFGTTTKEGKPFDLKSVREVSHYVVLDFPSQLNYFDFDQFLGYVKGEDGVQSKVNYTKSKKAGGMQAVDDLDIAIDIVTHNATMPAGFAATLRKNVEDGVKGQAYHISGKPGGPLTATYGTDKDEWIIDVWPKLGKPERPKTTTGMTDQQGPGAVFNIATGADAPFEKTMDEGKSTALVVDEAGGAALYEESPAARSDGTMGKRYWIMFRFATDKTVSRSGKITVFGEAGDTDMMTLPTAKISVGGLKDVDLKIAEASVRRLDDSTATKGALVVYRTPVQQTAVKDRKTNCAGVVAWWGISKPQALEYCQGDGKVH